MKAATLHLGPDKRHFVGTIAVDIPKGTDCTIRRIEGTDRYEMQIVEDRKILVSQENLAAFWVPNLQDKDQPPEQKSLFDVSPEYR